MGEIKECCKQEENLKEEQNEREDVTVRRCQVCLCRHITVEVEPGQFNMCMVNNR